ncbi:MULTISPECIES: TetR/AcrR family transcriptional regulator [unclassified Streptomyces]|uniref:TetR/AcrR family transcriptional regulator n=1 Tax=unclassified Streptomyces TaxID=2593676 RepID=UPI00136D8949|nr:MULTISPECIES: TetR/AcrR family transcriptional regulator [unclassified Streptomyces]MCW5251230.1 TetR/AcrR family transcriptional regulator [Streptomyces sp. SHP 1-2]MYU23272.1 TetR family transcriptional regulator [Streptomyces sp. SID8352]
MIDSAVALPQGRRQRNKARVQERLFEAAVELIARHGYDNTSIDEIAARADVARGTFFNYYPRKDDLISEWSARRGTELRRSLVTEAGGLEPGDTVSRFHRCLAALVELNEDRQEVNRSMVTAAVRAGCLGARESATAELFTAILTDGQARGEIGEGLDPDRLGLLLRDAYLGVLTRWAVGAEQDHASLYRELHEVFKVFLIGALPRTAHRDCCPHTA